jgi:two-component system sensor histidine kinase/response regulator
MSGEGLAQAGRILVVDDAMENIRILHQALGEEHEVLFALDGQKALEIARIQAPDLVLLDAVMPAMDGYAVCAELRKSAETQDIPIIFVTALEGPEDEMRALESGAVDFIHKPINGAVVRARVHTHLTLKRQRDQLREAGALLKESNQALQRSNKDLEQFAHLAAHDLQAPLNAIIGFAQLLSEECDGKLGDQAQTYLGFILDSTCRMQALIRDLLSYARLDSQTQPFEATDLGKVLGEVKFILAAFCREKNAEIEADSLPVLEVDRQQITQLLMNLVQNGIKYNQNRLPRVRVSASRADGEWVFAVEDNGIGIDPKFHEQIFEIFRRLHSSQAYPGTGIGLAICHRIVTRHRGRIWVESREGRGSTFYFTLPAGKSAD